MDMEQRTKITLAWELHEQGLSNSQIARRLEINRETINRWIAAIGEQGLLPFLEQCAAATAHAGRKGGRWMTSSLGQSLARRSLTRSVRVSSTRQNRWAINSSWVKRLAPGDDAGGTPSYRSKVARPTHNWQ
jgi:transposase-like protein